MIKEISRYIEQNVAGLTLGTNLFLGAFKEGSPDDGVAVIETPAGEVSFYLPDYQGKMIQIVCRSVQYLDSHDQALDIFEFLHGKGGVSLPVIDGGQAYLANVIEAVSPPGFIGQDERGLYEFVCNFIFRIQNK